MGQLRLKLSPDIGVQSCDPQCEKIRKKTKLRCLAGPKMSELILD